MGMRIGAFWCGIGATAVSLVGCGTTTEQHPATVSTVTVTSSSPSATEAATAAPTSTTRPGDITDQDRVFLAQLQSSSQWSFFSTVERGSLFDSAHMACNKFDTVGKVGTLQWMLNAGFNIDQATPFLVAAAMAYCPKNLSGVQ